MSYQIPKWAQTPPPQYHHEWFLTEIKGGVEVAKHPLHTQACTVLGRAADQVHIPLQHESASRQHARVAFDSHGIPLLKDLSSTHGTTCNKRRLPTAATGKHEASKTATHKGARGIMLFPGDILQFGASTRLFCVEGQEDFERGAWQAKQTQQELLAKQQQLEEEISMEQQREAASSMDEPEHDNRSDTRVAESSTKTVAMDAEVPEKHRKTLERLNGMKYNLQNLETEDERIR